MTFACSEIVLVVWARKGAPEKQEMNREGTAILGTYRRQEPFPNAWRNSNLPHLGPNIRNARSIMRGLSNPGQSTYAFVFA